MRFSTNTEFGGHISAENVILTFIPTCCMVAFNRATSLESNVGVKGRVTTIELGVFGGGNNEQRILG